MTTRKKLWIALLASSLLTGVLVSIWLTPKLMRRFYVHGLELVEVARGLEIPWSMAFLPDGSLLVTERVGRLRKVGLDGQSGEPITGLPPIAQGGEGGLLGVALSPDFDSSGRVFWSYSEPGQNATDGVSTAVASGILIDNALQSVDVIYRQAEKLSDNRHFGGRLLFDNDGHLLVGLGDRMVRDDAQRLNSAHGKLLRLMPDGSVPPDNPFVDSEDALGEIFSLGHRNIQGLAVNPQTGDIWASEHGPASGDEVNLIKPGANYGWPVVSYGCEYTTCDPIGEGQEKPGMESPATWFSPESVPPSAIAYITSDRYPAWKGHLLMGILHSRALMLMKLDENNRILERKPMWLGKYERVRDVQQGPDGWIYIAVQSPEGTILRLVPK